MSQTPVLVKLEDMHGYHLATDRNKVEKILAAIRRAGGNCPCVPNKTWNADTICPCLYYRSGNGCHCGLYEKD